MSVDPAANLPYLIGQVCPGHGVHSLLGLGYLMFMDIIIDDLPEGDRELLAPSTEQLAHLADSCLRALQLPQGHCQAVLRLVIVWTLLQAVPHCIHGIVQQGLQCIVMIQLKRHIQVNGCIGLLQASLGGKQMLRRGQLKLGIEQRTAFYISSSLKRHLSRFLQ